MVVVVRNTLAVQKHSYNIEEGAMAACRRQLQYHLSLPQASSGVDPTCAHGHRVWLAATIA